MFRPSLKNYSRINHVPAQPENFGSASRQLVMIMTADGNILNLHELERRCNILKVKNDQCSDQRMFLPRPREHM